MSHNFEENRKKMIMIAINKSEIINNTGKKNDKVKMPIQEEIKLR